MDHWKIWVDTGGTFTDCIAVDPAGSVKKVKVLSNSSLRGKITRKLNSNTFEIEIDWEAPDDFIKGFTLQLLDKPHQPSTITHFDKAESQITLEEPHQIKTNKYPVSFEVLSPDEAPVLAAKLATQTPYSTPLPHVQMRLATTKGTNALLEKKGAPTLFITTKGFKDLLKIGDQKRPDLFALEIIKPEQLYKIVLEADERMDADGKILKNLEKNSIEEEVSKFLKQPDASVALCLLHSYKNSVHEKELAAWLHNLGCEHISISSDLSPFIKLLPRAQTALVNAYLTPVLKKYITGVKEELSDGKLRIMTSAGGLVDESGFKPKDSLLSGPAGGVVGASSVGKQNGFSQIISFDMGGTSTDVARYDSGFDYAFSQAIGNARLSAPALAIETVAAGGGSICAFDGQKLTVGPESAGAYPGPACYGAGGPLTITDINLLLGRLDQNSFGIPISAEASKEKLESLLNRMSRELDHPPQKMDVMEGFLKIANERMADAIRKVSMRRGYDPASYAMVAFGGAGAQHACAIADQLSIEDVLIPKNAGLLSAYGLGHALVEKFVEKQILTPFDEVEESIPETVKRLGEQALNQLRKAESHARAEIRRRLVFMRLKGQESTIEVPYSQNLKEAFQQAYIRQYGHWISGRVIEVESIRVVASTVKEEQASSKSEAVKHSDPAGFQKIRFQGESCSSPVYVREQLAPGQSIAGPALILDPYSTIVLEPGWSGTVQDDATIKLSNIHNQKSRGAASTQSEAVNLELFTNRFTGIAEEMGEMLRRTALSVNVKERMDFSCALLNSEGELVVNAPHIPVHLGALGLCVRKLKDQIDMNQGDVVVTNHPVYGGSHLPDITVVTPVFDDKNTLLGYAANRAHHAEIGGTRPGSMPPNAKTLAEEGVVIPPMYLIKDGKEQWAKIREHLTEPPYSTRYVEENMADLQAAVAANQKGAVSLKKLASEAGTDAVRFYMDLIKKKAAQKAREMLKKLPDATYSCSEQLDDGSTLAARIIKKADSLTIDFHGTSNTHPGNLNATPAIVSSVVLYVLRVLINEPLPLNEGLLEPVQIELPECLLNPSFSENPEKCPAVVGGNTEVSQRLVDLLLKPFEKVACSQGTMNNVLFGNDNFGYYETIGGGTGAGPSFNGSDGVHHHMTNTSGTDPEIMEYRYPVRLEKYTIRKKSGGSGRYKGGDGIEREFTFLEPVRLSVLTQHRKEQPYGLRGGGKGKAGRQWILRKNGESEELSSVDGSDLETGDKFIIQTPGGGGFGSG